MSGQLKFTSSLSIEEIEENFKDFNFFEEMKESLSNAVARERKNTSSDSTNEETS